MSSFLSSSSNAVEQIGMEVALLIASAQAKGIDCAVWLRVEGDGRIPISDFNNRLISLSSAIGIQEDEATKRELIFSTSTSSLKNIAEICGVEEGGHMFIDAKLFLLLCKRKINRYMRLQGDFDVQVDAGVGDEAIEEDDEEVAEQPQRLVVEPSTHFEYAYDDDEFQEDPSDDFELTDSEHNLREDVEYVTSDEEAEYLRVRGHAIPAIHSLPVEITPSSRPKSAPANKTGGMIFTRMEEDEENDIPVRSSSRNVFESNREYNTKVHRSPESVNSLSLISNEDENPAPKPSEIDPSTESLVMMENQVFTADPYAMMPLPQYTLTAPRPARRASANFTLSHDDTNLHSAKQLLVEDVKAKICMGKSKKLSPEELQAHLEFLFCDAVRRPELFHILRVKLGLFDSNKPYTINPARGSIISSPACVVNMSTSARRVSMVTNEVDLNVVPVNELTTTWISMRDLQKALESVSVVLTDVHMVVVLKLIVIFATHCQQGKLPVSNNVMSELLAQKDSRYNKENWEWTGNIPADKAGDIPKVIMQKHSVQFVNAFWLSKYMNYIRLYNPDSLVTLSNNASLAHSTLKRSQSAPKRRCSVEEALFKNSASVAVSRESWLLSKNAADRQARKDKSLQFKRALAGLTYQLTKDEVNEMLLSSSFPANVVETEMRLRVDQWRFDCHGTKDFEHKFNLAVEKYKRSHYPGKAGEVKWRKLSADERTAINEKIVEEVCAAKLKEFQDREDSESFILRDLFWQYDKYIKSTVALRPEEALIHEYIEPSEKLLSINLGGWISRHLEQFENEIRKSRIDFIEREKAKAIELKSKSKVAPLNMLEQKLLKVSDSLPLFQKVELRKKLVELRKSAVEKDLVRLKQGDKRTARSVPQPAWLKCRQTGVATHGLVVSKGEFDQFLSGVINPCMKQMKGANVEEELLRSVDYTSIRRYDNLNDEEAVEGGADDKYDEEASEYELDNAYFKKDVVDAFKRSLEEEIKEKNIREKNFKEWKEAKDNQKREEEMKKKMSEEIKSKDAEKKAKRGRIAHKKWLKLANKNMYVSKTGNGTLKRPERSSFRIAERFVVDVPIPKEDDGTGEVSPHPLTGTNPYYGFLGGNVVPSPKKPVKEVKKVIESKIKAVISGQVPISSKKPDVNPPAKSLKSQKSVKDAQKNVKAKTIRK